ncbi:GNAT family N-acetyltransferase [Allostreptomyces psammosilenae]|uniref:Ribosomal protein S18 acetylase RimI-like enzyme n=1 Tax=Allostreptomyces psammosilenae TaxID=1892865 RepID=A0A852ZQQ8_9ACTN|nr:GNAT family N-acetyltransferase [Allostreptomyces psammosilenae]NYI04085.1 ribosomal protein S18 acetylase RimI-like enzyme [Allostreptomyces psammosilenae]
MTTTLRPAQGTGDPEPDGSRRRTFQVCDNGRPVGALTVLARRPHGEWVGALEGLEIEPPARRRGRGTIAVLAAEEVLREWGCATVEVRLPGPAEPRPAAELLRGEPGGDPAEPALRMAVALGYQEADWNMAKALTGPVPAPVPGLRPMTEAEFDAWWPGAVDSYARALVGLGMSEERARRKAEEDHRRLLPDGPRTADTYLAVLHGDGAPGEGEPGDGAPGDGAPGWLGTLGLGLLPPPHLAAVAEMRRGGWVWEVWVAEAARGSGHGRALMLGAERAAREAGRDRLGLRVVTDNVPARSLYRSLGYRVLARHLTKRLLP